MIDGESSNFLTTLHGHLQEDTELRVMKDEPIPFEVDPQKPNGSKLAESAL